DLFARNHYPLLKALAQAGKYTRVRTYVPTYHGDGRADWTFAVELVETANAPAVDEDALDRKLFPDKAKYEREEKRRFEILAAHWDVPLNVIDLDKRGEGKYLRPGRRGMTLDELGWRATHDAAFREHAV